MSDGNMDFGEDATENVRKALDNRYLSNLDLRGSGDVTLTVDRVFNWQAVKFDNGSTKDGRPVQFKERKKVLVLGRELQAAFIRHFNSAKPADWVGKKITLFADPEYRAFGETVGRIWVTGIPQPKKDKKKKN